MSKSIRTEHNGAKNGGGFWGTRYHAKKLSKIIRRRQDKQEAKKDTAGP